MENIVNYLDSRVTLARRMPDLHSRKSYYSQAFGVVEFFVSQEAEFADQLAELWRDRYRPIFEDLCASSSSLY